MPRQQRPHKTSGEVYEVFKRIGKVGGNTVGGLVIAGKIFMELNKSGALTQDQIETAAEAAGVSQQDLEQAFELVDQAREDLGLTEYDQQESDSKNDRIEKHH